MKYNPTQSVMAHNPFRSALSAGKNIQRPAKSAEAWCTYSSHKRNDTARPLATTIAPTTGRGLISACSMEIIKPQKSIRSPAYQLQTRLARSEHCEISNPWLAAGNGSNDKKGFLAGSDRVG